METWDDVRLELAKATRVLARGEHDLLFRWRTSDGRDRLARVRQTQGGLQAFLELGRAGRGDLEWLLGRLADSSLALVQMDGRFWLRDPAPVAKAARLLDALLAEELRLWPASRILFEAQGYAEPFAA